MADLREPTITLNAGRIIETVGYARAQIIECRSLHKGKLCILCTQRAAAIAALEAESPVVPVSPSAQDKNHG